ncbi:MAG TPA: T9SS type A sorting domain-containing protein [Saprospiraceae bacterium]|nr:T9SS type A sorting domain-containing protein [Saprospiraceae bacterium]
MRFFILFFLCVSFFAQAQNNIDPSLLEQFHQKEKVGFIVLLKDQADLSFIPRYAPKAVKGQMAYDALSEKARNTQGRIRQILENAQAPYRAFVLANAVYSKGDLALVKALANLPEVKTVMYDAPVIAEEPITIEYINNTVQTRGDEPEWGLRMIKADSVWLQGIQGAGVVVAGQDTGYDWEHPAIKDKYRGNGDVPDHNYNWHDAIHENNPHYPDSIPNPCGYSTMAPCQDHPHGTHTIGTMVGYAPDNVIGVAPQAQWIGCRNMDRGWGTPASYIECFEFFLAPTDLNGENPDVSQAPDVINNSWACPPDEGCNPDNFEIMEMVVNNLKAAGIVVVVSAGNSGGLGCGSVSTPAAIFENSFSVGATRYTDTLNFQDSIATFSSRGPVLVDGSGRLKPNVAAPGRTIKSCVPNNGYAYYSGTSMAGPHVAGAVALIISANPDLAGMVDTIEYILETTAVKKQAVDTCGGIPGSMIPNNTYGNGRINVYAAVQLAQTIDVVKTHQAENKQYMRISPNPASTQTKVYLSEKVSGKLRIYSALGQLMETTTLASGQTTIATSHFPKGVYYVQFQSKEHIEVHQLMIQ